MNDMDMFLSTYLPAGVTDWLIQLFGLFPAGILLGCMAYLVSYTVHVCLKFFRLV